MCAQRGEGLSNSTHTHTCSGIALDCPQNNVCRTGYCARLMAVNMDLDMDLDLQHHGRGGACAYREDLARILIPH